MNPPSLPQPGFVIFTLKFKKMFTESACVTTSLNPLTTKRKRKGAKGLLV